MYLTLCIFFRRKPRVDRTGRGDYGGSRADKEFDDCRTGPFQQGHTVCQQTLFVDHYCGH